MRHLVCFIEPKPKILSSTLAFALLLTVVWGTLFAHTKAVEASFFSSLSSLFVGDQAYADANTNAVNSPQSGDNLQTMVLPRASASPISVSQDKDNTSNKKDGQIDANASVNIVSDTSLMPATGPLGVSDGKNIPDPSFSLKDQTSVYVVRQGDNLAEIAKMFGVSVNTILWGNNMKKGDKLNEGDVLFILPVSGLEHTVTKGQTLQSIAKLYKADINDIIQYNDVTLDTQLAVGDTLMIPDGQKSEENDKPIKNLGASIAKDKKYYESHPVQNLAGYFIDPVPGYRKSQGIHDNNGVDLAIGRGTPIHAAAAGRVILARSGYNGGFGYLTIIAHPNGTETVYAHQSKIVTTAGSEVYQGEVIGYVGSTGHSTGPHLHFEVHGARNPGADASWKY